MANHQEYLSSTNIVKGIAILTALITAFSLATGNFLGGTVHYDLEMTSQDYLGILTHLAIISLVTERFVEIFTSVIRKPKRVVLEGDYREASSRAEKNSALEALDIYKSKTGIFALIISFATGLVIASAGIHVLGPLFDTSQLTPTQSTFFNGIDIVITAGLIAGGSKGVNSLTASIGAVFEAMKYQARDTQEKAKQGKT